LRIRRHFRIIQVAQKLQWHSHSWLCASNKCNGPVAARPFSVLHVTIRGIATRPQPITSPRFSYAKKELASQTSR
jgi:hypothetical protein